MDSTFATKAIVLDRQPTGEVDSRVAFYSLSHGRLDLVARGTAKLGSKLAGHLEPFNLVELMVVRGRGVDYAAGAANLDTAWRLKSDGAKIMAGGYVLGHYKKLIKTGEADKTLFLFLWQFIAWLDNIQATPLYYDLMARLAVWQLIVGLGLVPARLDQATAEFYRLPAPSANLIKILESFGRQDFLTAAKNLRVNRRQATTVIIYLDKVVAAI